MSVDQVFNTNTRHKLALCGTPSFHETNVMHAQNWLNRFQALAIIAGVGGVPASTSGAGAQAGNHREDSITSYSVDETEGGRQAAPCKYPPRLMVDNA